jgi:hypothetical protein
VVTFAALHRYNLCKRVFGVEHIRLHSSLVAFFSHGWKEVFEARGMRGLPTCFLNPSINPTLTLRYATVKLLLRLSGADLAAIANFPRALISEERIWEPQSYHLRYVAQCKWDVSGHGES